MPVERFGLYLVITNPATSYEKCAEAAVKAGLSYVQLRMKHAERDRILAKALNLRAITRGSNTRFIVNDDPALAVESAADGVHLGQNDMPLPEARRLFPSLKLLGLSTHNPEQAQQAATLNPDYCGVGPVFATPTKDIPDPTLGPELAGQIIRQAPFTTVAIGGIDRSNLATVLRAGAINFAVVREVCLDPAPYDAIRRLQDIWQANQ
ncbi:MAG: thiamine phosphate synthase [Kiritimatiellae bacterium]|nr:thiamine phosphate synthase [Kiritimatiellia bacterium]